MEQIKKFSPALFALIMFCFLLPFFTVSFYGQRVASESGIQLIFGDMFNVSSSELWKNTLLNAGDRTTVFLAYIFFPILVSLVAFLGLVISYLKLSFLKMGNKSFLIMILSISGAVILFLQKNSLEKSILSFEGREVFIEYEFGYWFALLLFIVTAIIQGIIFNQERKMNSVK